MRIARKRRSPRRRLRIRRQEKGIDYDELKDFIEKIHFETFGMTVEERQKSLKLKPGKDEDCLEIPTFVRQGIKLEF